MKKFAELPKDYAGLCHLHLPRLIRSKADFENVRVLTDAMAGHDLNPDQEDYFDLLCRLIEDYDHRAAEELQTNETDR